MKAGKSELFMAFVGCRVVFAVEIESLTSPCFFVCDTTVSWKVYAPFGIPISAKVYTQMGV